MKPINILLVEDNPADVRLVKEALKSTSKRQYNLNVVGDGVEAISYLKKSEKYADKPEADLVLLDINLPKKNGHQVLAEIKNDPALKTTPVIILTTSSNREDIHSAYSNHANCYITKPQDFVQFLNIAGKIESFWLETVKLPSRWG